MARNPNQVDGAPQAPSVRAGRFTRHHARALSLGARLLRDRADDQAEPIRVYADPAGHPFCIFVAADPSIPPAS